jgi:hypothetical protein
LLDQPISTARGALVLYEIPERMISPEISGRRDSFYEWGGSGVYIPGSEQGAMYRSERILSRICFGHDSENFYLRFDLHKWADTSLQIEFRGSVNVTVRSGTITNGTGQQFTITRGDQPPLTRDTLAAKRIIELALALDDLGLKPGEPVSFQVKVYVDGIERERYPESVPIQFTLLGEEHLLENWLI